MYDFLDESQAPNYNPPSSLSVSGTTPTTKTISLVDFINSNDPTNQYTLAKPDIVQTLTTADSIYTVNPSSVINNNVKNSKVSLVDFINRQNKNIDPAYYSGYFSKDKQK